MSAIPPKKTKKVDPSDYNWSKFKWRDWQGDPALRMCSPAARGVWMDMLAIMFEATPRGELLVNGRQPTMAQLGSVFGVAEKVARSLVDELENCGVFSRTESNVIYSRRMVRDKALSDTGRAYGSTGGNPALTKKDNQDGTDEPDEGNGGGLTPPVKGAPYEGPISGRLNLEDRSPSEKNNKPPSLRDEPPSKKMPDVPDWVPADAWNGFVAMRKASRKPLTAHAADLTIKQLAKFRLKGLDIEEALNQSVRSGWAGVFEPKNASAGRPNPASTVTDMREALLRRTSTPTLDLHTNTTVRMISNAR